MRARPVISRFLLALKLIVLFSSAQAWAWPPTYGLEFNLVSKKLEKIWSDRLEARGRNAQAPTRSGEFTVAAALVEKLKEKCLPECTVTEHPGKWLNEWKFTFADGFKFNISIDPSTVEVQVGPYTLEEWKAHESKLGTYLYEVPYANGLQYESLNVAQENTAHLNIGVKSAFGTNGKALARYLADYWQYAEMGDGLIGRDHHNAPPMPHLSTKQQLAAQELISSFNLRPGVALNEVANEIQNKVYTRSPGHTSGETHYQSVGLKYVTQTQNLREKENGDLPLELRANRNPTTPELALLQLELQERRMKYLQTLADEPVLLHPLPLEVGMGRSTMFFLYLADMGAEAEYDRFAKLLPPYVTRWNPYDWVTGKLDLAVFEKSKAVEFSMRARHSAYLRQKLKTALLKRGAASSEHAYKVLLAWEPLISEFENDPLRIAWMEIASSPQWKKHPMLTEARNRIESRLKHVVPSPRWVGCNLLVQKLENISP